MRKNMQTPRRRWSRPMDLCYILEKKNAKDKARFVLLSHMPRLFTNCGPSYIEEFWFDTFIAIGSSALYIGTNHPISRIVIQSYSPWILTSFSFLGSRQIYSQNFLCSLLYQSIHLPLPSFMRLFLHTHGLTKPQGGASKFHILFSKMH